MRGETTRVLIADQVGHIRSALRLALHQDPGLIVVGEAADVQQAVAEASVHQPDVALVEWELPSQNGSSVLSQLRAVRPGLAVIATSARAEARAAALAAGADGFVSKLDPPERLLATMHDYGAQQDNSGEA